MPDKPFDRGEQGDDGAPNGEGSRREDAGPLEAAALPRDDPGNLPGLLRRQRIHELELYDRDRMVEKPPAAERAKELLHRADSHEMVAALRGARGGPFQGDEGPRDLGEHWDRARSLRKQALKAASAAEDLGLIARANGALSLDYAKAGEWEPARQYADRAGDSYGRAIEQVEQPSAHGALPGLESWSLGGRLGTCPAPVGAES